MQAAEGDTSLVRFINLLRRYQREIFDPLLIQELLDEANIANPSISKAVPAEILSKLKIETFSSAPNVPEHEAENCSVCLGRLQDGESIKKLPCKHIYHPICIDTWLTRRGCCPVCKQSVVDALNSKI